MVDCLVGNKARFTAYADHVCEIQLYQLSFPLQLLILTLITNLQLFYPIFLNSKRFGRIFSLRTLCADRVLSVGDVTSIKRLVADRV